MIERMEDNLIYAAIGADGFARLVSAFYRQVPADPILGPMYPAAGLAGAERRLREFLVFRFGGPPYYLEQRGHPRLQQRHLRFPITPAARDRWFELMQRALDEAQLPAEAAHRLREFFAQTSTFLINRSESEAGPAGQN